jgi:predicted permease
MEIATTIIPIFTVIFIGWVAHFKGFLNPEFVGPANRLVYYIAIPALVFRAISGASMRTQFNPLVVFITLLAVVSAFFLAWCLGKRLCTQSNQTGTFVQISFHGNIGYIGLAVAFYYLGDEGLIRASILSGFIILLQNFLSVFILQFYVGDSAEKGRRIQVIKDIAGNPVVLSTLAGIGFSAGGITVPLVVDRGLHILAGLALPMALLVIGASLTFEQIRSRLTMLLPSSGIKLVFLPVLGWVMFKVFGIPAQEYLPALILLATPTATVSYVMAREMGGDADLAVSAISGCTLMSSITMSSWLKFLG